MENSSIINSCGRNIYGWEELFLNNSKYPCISDGGYEDKVTKQDMCRIFSAYTKDRCIKILVKGENMRIMSYQDNYVAYAAVDTIVSGLNEDNITLGVALRDPSVINKYTVKAQSSIDPLEREHYKAFKKEMNEKYGFLESE